MAIIFKNNLSIGSTTPTIEPRQQIANLSEIERPGVVTETSSSVQLIVNGKPKKLHKTSTYLLDMMSDDIDN